MEPDLKPNVNMELLKLQQAFVSNANWFFWIAGLSLVNAVVVIAGSDWTFLVGLGTTLIVTVLIKAAEAGPVADAIALAISAAIAGVFVVFGVLARKMRNWAFIVGGILYAIDGALFYFVPRLLGGPPDWLSIGFHVLVLFFLFQGFKAGVTLKQVLSEAQEEFSPEPLEAADVDEVE